MGIPGFFNLVSKKYNILETKKNIYLDVFIDFNSLIYSAKNVIYICLLNYIRSKINLSFDEKIEFEIITNKLKLDKIISNFDFKKSLNRDDKEELLNIRDEMLFNNITELVKNILSKIIPNSLHIYMDGVPNCSKIIEQRKRTLIGKLISEGRKIILEEYKNKITEQEYFLDKIIQPIINLDRNLIKPGTDFMKRLGIFLETIHKKDIIKFIKLKNPDFSDFNISNVDEKGEAEHKILEILIKQNYKNILVFSPDADLIILLLPLTKDKYIYLIRDSIKPDLFYINKLYLDLIEHITNGLTNKNLIDTINKKKSRIIKDICFIYNIFGNDFVPKLDNINIYDKKVIDNIIKTYITFLENNYTEDKKIFIITKKGDINWSNYLKYIYKLNKIFPYPIITSLYKTKQLKIDNYYNQIYSLDNYNLGIYKKNPDKYIWKNNFYDNKQFFDNTKDDIIKDYLLSIFMINILYSKIYYSINDFEKKITFLWYYIHHKSPLLFDIHEYLKKNITNIDNILQNHFKTFSKKFTFTDILSIQQLYYTIPLYEDFIKITKSNLPKLPEHELFDEYLKLLKWDNEKKMLNINDIIDCNMQRYLEKCVPSFKIKNVFVNLVFNLDIFIK